QPPGSYPAKLIGNWSWRENGGGPAYCRSVDPSRLHVDKPPRELQGCRRKAVPAKTVLGSEMVEKRPVRRVVTGHDADGKAGILLDAPTPYVNQRGEGNVVQLLWITNESPVDLSHTRDQASQKTGVPPPRNGSICRVVDFAPYDGKVPQGIDHHEILKQMGID